MPAHRETLDMHRKTYDEEILAAYRGEIAGEALFSRLLERQEDIGTRHVLACMLQRLRQLLSRLDLPVAEPEADQQAGRDWADALRADHGDGWPAAFAGQVETYALRYEALRDRAHPADGAALDYLAAHERALQRALEALVRHAELEAGELLAALLHYPPARPAQAQPRMP
jgi:hypothetical protein